MTRRTVFGELFAATGMHAEWRKWHTSFTEREWDFIYVTAITARACARLSPYGC